MDYVEIYSKYRHYPTKWYIGLKNGKLHATTRGRELDTVLAEEVLGGRWGTELAAVDPTTQEVFFLPGYGERGKRAMKLARNIQEAEFLYSCPPSLVRAIEKGDREEIARRAKRNRGEIDIPKLLSFLEDRGLLDNETKARLLASAFWRDEGWRRGRRSQS